MRNLCLMCLLSAILSVESGASADVQVGDPAKNLLVFRDDGTLSSWKANGREVLRRGAVSGFEVKDETTGKSAFVTGRPALKNGILEIAGKSAYPPLDCLIRVKPAGGNLNVHAEFTDPGLADRAITVRLRLHLIKSSWKFGSSWYGQNMATATYPGQTYGQADSLADKKVSQLPLSAVMDDNTGIAMAYSMKDPRLFLFLYAVDAQGFGEYSMSVPLGLAKETAGFPGKAHFSFSLMSFRNEYGFRTALAHYYRSFPECFESRSRQAGGWTLWLPADAAGDAAACGMGFNQCEFEDWKHHPEVFRATRDAGLMVTQYSEPWGYWVPIPKGWGAAHLDSAFRKRYSMNYPLRTAEYCKLLDEDLGDQRSADRFPGLTRDFVARAIRNTAVWRTPDGEWAFNCNYPFKWGGRKGWDSTIIIADSNPALPSPNRWDVQMNQIRHAEELAEKAGAKLDVVYLDSLLFMLGWNEYNFRREHWKYMDIPLTFTRLSDGKAVPAAHQALSNLHFLRKNREFCREKNYLVMANSWNPVIVFNIAYLDVLGAGEHASRKGLPPLADFATIRLLAFRKPVSVMDYVLSFKDTSAGAIEKRANYCLLYGIYPGTANSWRNPEARKKLVEALAPYAPLFKAINSAGYEVEPRAAVMAENKAEILFERWGNDVQKGLYFTVRNTGKQNAGLTLRFRPDDLNPEYGESEHWEPVAAMNRAESRNSISACRELLSGRKYPVSVSDGVVSVKLNLPPERTVLLQFVK